MVKEKEKKNKMVKIITNQSGTKGFICQGQFITDPYSSE